MPPHTKVTAKQPHELATRHVTAARAFHTGLVAETQRHLYVLRAVARHIELLRQRRRPSRERLVAAEACCEHMKTLESLRQPWLETFRDLRTSLHNLRALLRLLTTQERQTDLPRDRGSRPTG